MLKNIKKNSENYKSGFKSKIDQIIFPKGINQEVIERISFHKNEPKWLLDFRLKAFSAWQKMEEPKWSEIDFNPINYQEISYFAEPKNHKLDPKSTKFDPQIIKTFKKLGLPFTEHSEYGKNRIATDYILDSTSVQTTFQAELKKLGIVFCPISEACIRYPELLKKYLGTVVNYRDNFFACLNSAVFSDGSFVFIPKNIVCPMDLASYFRLNAEGVGQFERTLIIAEDDSYVSYLEGCTAPARSDFQLHSAVVEIVALNRAKVDYATVQNWYPGSKTGKGGVLNFVTKRALAKGRQSKICWTQLEVGSSKTWKYPSVILKGEESQGEFYSVALTTGKQQADTGTKMIHLAQGTKSRIYSQSIATGNSKNTFRSLVKMSKNARNCENHTRCDNLLLSKKAISIAIPTIESHNRTSHISHEAFSSHLDKTRVEYLRSRGLSEAQAESLLVTGFCKNIIEKLPLEFAVEARQLISFKLVNF